MKKEKEKEKVGEEKEIGFSNRKIRVSFSEPFKIAEYQYRRVEASFEANIEENEDIFKAYDTAYAFVEEAVFEEIKMLSLKDNVDVLGLEGEGYDN